MDTNLDEEVETLAEPEYAEEVQTILLAVVGADGSSQVAACVGQQECLHSPGLLQTNKPDPVAALPRRERNMESCYATLSLTKCQVLPEDKEIVTRKNNDNNNVQQSSAIINILAVEKLNVEKKLRELELDDIRADYNFNPHFIQQTTRCPARNNQKQSAVESEENIGAGTRRIVLSNTQVNKNRPKLLGPSRFGY